MDYAQISTLAKKLNENIKLFDKNVKEIQQSEKYTFISFLYGRQVTSVYNYLQGGSDTDVKHILRFILNGSTTEEKNEEEEEIEKQEEEEDEDSDIDKTKESKQTKINKPTEKLGPIYEKDTLIKIDEYLHDNVQAIFSSSTHPNLKVKLDNGIYFFISSEIIEFAVSKLCLQLTDKNPSAAISIICNRETTSEEILAFFTRSGKVTKAPFIIGNFYNLRSMVQSQVIQYLKNQAGKSFKGKIIFILNNDEVNSFKQSFEQFGFFKRDLISCCELKEFKPMKSVAEGMNVSVVLSEQSGLGKSTWVKNQKQYDNIYTFTFGDATPLQSIIQRIRETFERVESINTNTNDALHFAIYDSDTVDKVTSFLFNAVVTRCLKFKEKLLIKELVVTNGASACI